MQHYDLIVIGTGPAGQKGAIQAAKLGKSVAIIEKNAVLGGAQINTGTVPSKALREAVLHLTGANRGGLFGENTRTKKQITINDLTAKRNCSRPTSFSLPSARCLRSRKAYRLPNSEFSRLTACRN